MFYDISAGNAAILLVGLEHLKSAQHFEAMLDFVKAAWPANWYNGPRILVSIMKGLYNRTGDPLFRMPMARFIININFCRMYKLPALLYGYLKKFSVKQTFSNAHVELFVAMMIRQKMFLVAVCYCKKQKV